MVYKYSKSININYEETAFLQYKLCLILIQEREDGLYICMEKFYGFGRKYVEEYHRKTGRALFLHLRRIKRAIGKSKENASEENTVAQPPAEKVNHE